MGKSFSILVSCFNQADFVLECLESIKSQSYKNFQIVISDDSSTDNSVSLINNWLKNNEGLDSILITSPENTGVALNFQRGLSFCTGLWVKAIAADDKLLPDCLLTIVGDSINSDVDLIYSKSRYFTVDATLFVSPKYSSINFYNKDELRNYFYFENFLNSPTLFYRRSKLVELGGFVTKYRNMEDYPTALRMIQNNSNVKYINKVTVLYRITNVSLSNFNAGGNRVNKHFLDSSYKFYKNELRAYHKSKSNVFFIIIEDMKFFFLKIHVNQSNYIMKLLFWKASATLSKLSSLYISFYLGKNKIFRD
jgi:glycosyltransferase involved in cell wall biosynthesis